MRGEPFRVFNITLTELFAHEYQGGVTYTERREIQNIEHGICRLVCGECGCSYAVEGRDVHALP